ncbi:MAG: SixA phosphatase family protein, partial [Bacteroidia bacterium]
MKYLLLIRHAKTEQQGYDHDFERELTKRGTEDCKLMAERLKKTGFVPDLIKISTAKRTQQTAKLLAKHLGWKKGTVEGYEKLYLATPNAILNEIVNT